MLDKRELRIGNSVMCGDTIAEIVDAEVIDRLLFEGVPITEERLSILGFEKSLFYNNTYSKPIQTLNGSHDIFIDVSANILLLDTIEIGEFKYVHQIENLHFALTGQELV